MPKLYQLLTFVLLLGGCTAPALLAQKRSSPFAGRYAEDFAKGEVEIEATYQRVITRTPEGKYAERTYFPETKQIIRYVEFADKKRKVSAGADWGWYDTGELRFEGQNVNDNSEGNYRYYAREGHLSSEGEYRAGKRVGNWTDYHANGTVRQVVAYRDGQLDGQAIQYDSTGAVTDTVVYAAGKLIGGRAAGFRRDEGGEVYQTVERMPLFPGCEEHVDYPERKACADKTMLNYVYQHIRYPMRARQFGVEGMAVVSFVIERNGEITRIESVRGISEDIRDEVLQLVSGMPRWEPGMVDGEPVRVQFNLPVKFKLE